MQPLQAGLSCALSLSEVNLQSILSGENVSKCMYKGQVRTAHRRTRPRRSVGSPPPP